MLDSACRSSERRTSRSMASGPAAGSFSSAGPDATWGRRTRALTMSIAVFVVMASEQSLAVLAVHDGGLGRPDRRIVLHRTQRQRLAPDPGADRGARGVQHRGAQVSEQIRRITTAPPVPVQAEEGLLHHVLRGRLVADEQQGEPDKRQAMGPVQVLDFLADWLRHREVVPDANWHAYRTPPSTPMLPASAGSICRGIRGGTGRRPQSAG